MLAFLGVAPGVFGTMHPTDCFLGMLLIARIPFWAKVSHALVRDCPTFKGLKKAARVFSLLKVVHCLHIKPPKGFDID